MNRFLTLVLLLFLSIALHAQEKPEILIAYYSQSGNTNKMAESVAQGAESVDGVSVRLLSIDQVQSNDLLRADAIIIGSPVYNANVAPAVQEFINSWPFENRPLKDKIGAAFTTGGGISIGEEGVMLNLIQSMLIHGMIITGGDTTESAFGASAITGEGPFKKDQLAQIFIDKGLGLGKRVAELTLRVK